MHFQILLLAVALGILLTSGLQATPWSILEHLESTKTHSMQRTQQALTPEQWTRKYWCDLAAPNSSLVQSTSERRLLIESQPWPRRLWYSLMHECSRDQTVWRIRYIDEMLDDYKVLVKDSHLDERLANILFTMNIHSLMDSNYFKFNSGDPRVDRQNALRVAGPQVDDGQCELDLYEMSQQLDELAEYLEKVRLDPNNTQPLGESHIKLARALDAYGRYESGTLSSNMRFPGAYGQCIKAVLERRQASEGSSKDMSMRFCWARLNFHQRLNRFAKQRQNEPHETRDDTLPVGICLPRSCHSKSLESSQIKRLVQKLLNSQVNFPSSIYLDQHPDLESIFCLPDEDSDFLKMPLSGKLWIALTACWILVCCIATYFRIGEELEEQSDGVVKGLEQVKQQQMTSFLGTKQQGHQEKEQEQKGECKRQRGPAWRNVGRCLNLNLSWKDFTSDRIELDATAPVDLDVLNPVRVLACLFCVIAHSSLMYSIQSRYLLDTAAQVERDPALQAALSTSTVIDTFYVISGLLISFLACKKLARLATSERTRSNISIDSNSASSINSSTSKTSLSVRSVSHFLAGWCLLAANRYLRLVPLYAFVFYFRRDVFKYLGSGPFWDYGLNKDTMTGACDLAPARTPFNLEMLGQPLNRQCLTTSWTITNDILFGLLIPPFLLLLQKRPRLTLRAMCALVVLCSIYGIKILIDEPNADRFELLEIRMIGVLTLFNGMTNIYTSPIIRAACFLVGAIAGYALFNYANQGVNRHWPQWLTGIATKLSVAYLLLHIVVSTLQMHFSALFSPYHRLYTAYIMTLDRSVWSVANAVLFLRMTTDWRHGPFMSRSASQIWKSLARLNYPLLFVHWLIILVQNGVITMPPSYSHWNLFASFATVYMASMPISLFLHVVFENPMDKLIKRQLMAS